MRPIPKVFFFSLVIFLVSFSPPLTAQPDSHSDFKAFRRENRDSIHVKSFDENLDSCAKFFAPYKLTGRREVQLRNSDSAPLSFVQQKVMERIVDDFLVNDDTCSACSQINPAIALDPSGNFIIAWYDERNWDSSRYDIYAQRYDSLGTLLGFNLKVNNDSGFGWQRWPSVAMDGSGNFVITWVDERSGYRDIYAQRYDSSGSPVGLNFKVNDDTGAASQLYPAVISDDAGNFVITWQDYRNGNYNYDIYAQRYDSSGAPLDSNFRVNDDTGPNIQAYPAIAIDGFGDFVITWHDYRHGSMYVHIYAQRYESSGTPLGSNFKVSEDVGNVAQVYPAVATDDSGNFIITWENTRNGWDNYDIYAQRYDSSGAPLGSNFRVNDDTGITEQKGSAVASDSSGNFVITWKDERNSNSDIYAQRYNSDGSSEGSNYLVLNPQYAYFGQVGPAVVANSSHIYFTWMDNRRGKGWDIYAKVIDWGWPRNVCGDVNKDDEIDIADVVYLINYLFIGGPAPNPLWVGDVNSDEVVDVTDVVYLINYLFIGGPLPGCM